MVAVPHAKCRQYRNKLTLVRKLFDTIRLENGRVGEMLYQDTVIVSSLGIGEKPFSVSIDLMDESTDSRIS